jgi:hypothetical protein
LLPSIQLSCNDHTNQKETRYFENISWHGPGYAAPAQKNPRDVFEQLFGKPKPSTKSILDVVQEDAQRLGRKLGGADRAKLGEYLDSIRGIELRMQRAEQKSVSSTSMPSKPTGVPDDRGEYLRLMGDIIAIAFQQDRTRVATLLVDPERWDTPRMYQGVFDDPQNHHVLTHTKGEEAKAKLQKIDRFHVEQFAYLVKRLSEIPEGDGTLLDNCLISLGSECTKSLKGKSHWLICGCPSLNLQVSKSISSPIVQGPYHDEVLQSYLDRHKHRLFVGASASLCRRLIANKPATAGKETRRQGPAIQSLDRC